MDFINFLKFCSQVILLLRKNLQEKLKLKWIYDNKSLEGQKSNISIAKVDVQNMNN